MPKKIILFSLALAAISIKPTVSCPQFMPPHPDFCKDGTIIPGEKNKNGCQLPSRCEAYPLYGHAPDYSWVSGKLKYNKLEGGCWSINFSESQEDESNYNGVFALNLKNQEQYSNFNDGNFVILKGKIIGKKFSMACPLNIYGADEILNNGSSQPKNTKFVINKVISDIKSWFKEIFHIF